MVAPQERASGSADAGPFFAKQPAAQAQVLPAKAPPAVLFERTDLSEQPKPGRGAEVRCRLGGNGRAVGGNGRAGHSGLYGR